jgi:hypothetical protein
MEPALLGDFVKNYGWAVFMAWVAVDKIWPYLSQSLFPQRAAERKAEREAEIKREERQIAAYEQIAKAMAEITVSNAMGNERLNQMAVMLMENNRAIATFGSSLSDHHRMTSEAIATMKERTQPHGKTTRARGGTE